MPTANNGNSSALCHLTDSVGVGGGGPRQEQCRLQNSVDPERREFLTQQRKLAIAAWNPPVGGLGWMNTHLPHQRYRVFTHSQMGL